MAARAQTELSPVVLEVIEGCIRSAELEIEAAVERTSRSPMIRDQHDYRVALFDAKGRKLTGRSYSAVVEPVFERWSIDDIRPGDVFFWNDPYNSTGGIGHVPDLCTTVPIFFGERLVAFAQVFGHHDDVGGMVPGSLPVHATSIFQEGLMVPPIKLYDAGARNDAAFEIICRNSRLPDHLRGDVDAEIGACLVGARRVTELCDRYGSGRRRSRLPGADRQLLAHGPRGAPAEDRRRSLRSGRTTSRTTASRRHASTRSSSP